MPTSSSPVPVAATTSPTDPGLRPVPSPAPADHRGPLRRRGTALAVAVVLGAAATACGSTSSGHSGHGGTASAASVAPSSVDLGAVAGRARSSAHDAADVSFAQMMVVHHRQAVEMAALAATRASSPRVEALAAQISADQQPEITAMTGWLDAWGAPATSSSSSTASSMDGMDGMDGIDGMDGMDGMDGIMGAADTTRLAALSGAAFDRRWLSMMTEHHEGAITMARRELTSGRSADALALAAGIVVTQQAQVRQMRQL